MEAAAAFWESAKAKCKSDVAFLFPHNEIFRCPEKWGQSGDRTPVVAPSPTDPPTGSYYCRDQFETTVIHTYTNSLVSGTITQGMIVQRNVSSLALPL